MTPDQVHYGQADEVYAARQKLSTWPFNPTQKRFVKKPPEPPLKPTAAWIKPANPKAEKSKLKFKYRLSQSR